MLPPKENRFIDFLNEKREAGTIQYQAVAGKAAEVYGLRVESTSAFNEFLSKPFSPNWCR